MEGVCKRHLQKSCNVQEKTTLLLSLTMFNVPCYTNEFLKYTLRTASSKTYLCNMVH